MSAAAPAFPEPQILHAIPGRVRVSLPGWTGQNLRSIESHLVSVPGVCNVRANPVTGNVVIQFDPRQGKQETILAAVRELEPARDAPITIPGDAPTAAPGRSGGRQRARIALPGLDRDPDLAGRVEEQLLGRLGVLQARASLLTGRLLVEFDGAKVSLDELIAEVGDVVRASPPAGERPVRPPDTSSLLANTARAAGAAIALAFVSARRLRGRLGPVGGSTYPAELAAIVGMAESFPIVRDGMRRLLGATTADLLLAATGSATLALSDSPLGLSLSAAEGLLSGTTAYAERAAWHQHGAAASQAVAMRPGAVIHLEANDRTPRAATILQGTGTAVGRDGLLVAIQPGRIAPAGARLWGGPFVVRLLGEEPFVPVSGATPVRERHVALYVRACSFGALAYAALTALLTRSAGRALAAMLLVNPRTAVVGTEAADAAAMARAIRGGATVIGTRPARKLRRPDLLLLDCPRLLTDGVELATTLPFTDSLSVADIQQRAAAVALGAGSPWGSAFSAVGGPVATDGIFDDDVATALLDGVRYALGPLSPGEDWVGVARLQERGEYVLLLRREGEPRPLGVIGLRPRLATGVETLVAMGRQHHVELGVVAAGDVRAAEAISRRVNVPLVLFGNATAAVLANQHRGDIVALVADGVEAEAAFETCDLAIGVSDGNSEFPTRADILAPNLTAVADIIEAAARRDAAVRDSVLLSLVANVAGAVWGLRGAPGLTRASNIVYAAAFAALADGWLRLRGGERPESALDRVVDPRPESWARQDVASVLRALETTEEGLSSAAAAQRFVPPAAQSHHNALWRPLVDQLHSPLIGVLAAGAALSLATGGLIDVVMIGAVIAANVAIGAWQEKMAERAAQTLAELGVPTARVLRDGQPVTISATQVVPGDVLVLAPGDRVAADARLMTSQGIEVDEASLTGESLPVAKAPDGAADADRIVLDGSDVVAGTGRAVVVAAGPNTRLGATAAVLATESEAGNPLDVRLHQTLRFAMPIAVAGGAIVAAAGLLRGQPQVNALQLGASIAVAAVPEGLPLLTQIGEASIARRLARRGALVRRLSATEALGRVDVACADKTGTMTTGKLALSVVADLEQTVNPADGLTPGLRDVLLVGALASPRPDNAGAAAHPTDVAVVNGAIANGIEHELHVTRDAECPFEPGRAFYAAVANGRLCVKGAPEVIAARCDRVRVGKSDQPLDAESRQHLIDRGETLAAAGLRVLMVAAGGPGISPEDPAGLIALGYLGISDPLKPNVPAAVRQCHDAGIHVIMITGDHPATARAIGRAAGLLDGDDGLVNADHLARLDLDQLGKRLERVSVIARATPLDKLRIIEGLQHHGHTVAMTGDGANDGPALRLADVGVGMGHGTEVARQAADVVIADDDFSTLVEAFVEGRSFWRNFRRALGLLVGGNLGELGLLIAPSLLNLPHPFVPAQILAINMISDVLPALAVTLQPAAHRSLSGLAREGAAALEAPLRRDMMRRAAATALPSLAAYLVALGAGSPQQAAAVAFASVTGNQLAQTLELGWSEGRPTPAILGAVASSAALLVIALLAPPVSAALGLVAPSPVGWLLIGASAAAALLINRALTEAGFLSDRVDSSIGLTEAAWRPVLAPA